MQTQILQEVMCSLRTWHYAWFLVIALTVAAPFALASEHGASAWPLGVEGVMRVRATAAWNNDLQNYEATYNAGELDNANGKSAVPDFKILSSPVSIRLKHNWEGEKISRRLSWERSRSSSCIPKYEHRKSLRFALFVN